MYDLRALSLVQMIECGAGIRRLRERTTRFDQAAARVVRHLHRTLYDGTSGESAVLAIRCYRSCSLSELTAALRKRVGAVTGSRRSDRRCLLRVASAGSLAKGKDSARANALDPEVVLLGSGATASPPLLNEIASLWSSTPGSRGKGGNGGAPTPGHGVLCVSEAEIPERYPALHEAQTGVPVRSILAFGGLLPQDSMFAVLVFARIPIPRETVSMFRTIALNVKLALLPHSISVVRTPPAVADSSRR